MPDTEQDILRDAIIGTEQEIFGDAFGKDDVTLDETGDRSHEAMGDGLEGQHEPDEDEDEPEGEDAEGEGEPEKVEAKAEPDKPEAKPEPKDEPQGRVPAGRLREQTERTRAAETERDALKARLEAAEAESRKQVEALRAEFMAALRQQPKPVDPPKPTDAPKPDAPPDLFENPQAFAEYVRSGAAAQVQTLSQQMENMRVNMSMENAHVRHGDTFLSAMQSVQKLDPNSPDNRDLVRRIYTATNPGEALVQWHKRTETLREVGDDPAAYKAKIAEDERKRLASDPEFRKQVLAELRGEAMTGDDGRTRTTTRLPASLNRAAGGNTRAPNDLEVFDGSDQAIFSGAFTTI